MSTGEHSEIESGLQEARLWLDYLKRYLRTTDDEVAYAALRGTLHALRDRLGPTYAAALGTQLPIVIRGLYYEGWQMAVPPTGERHLSEFLAHVGRELKIRSTLAPETAARGVLALVWERVDRRKVGEILAVLPEELRDLWPAGSPQGCATNRPS